MRYSTLISALIVLVGNASVALATDTAGTGAESDTTEGRSHGMPTDTDSESSESSESSDTKKTEMDVGTSEVDSPTEETETTADETNEPIEAAEESEVSDTGSDANTEPVATETDDKEADKVTKSPIAMTKQESQSASSSEAASREVQSGPLPPEKVSLSARRSYAIAVAKYNREYEKNRLMQVMGQSLLVASFAFEIIGTVLIEAASYGWVGQSGFALVGVGLAHFVASAFLLGLSKPAHHLAPPRNIYERRIAGQYSPELLIVL